MDKDTFQSHYNQCIGNLDEFQKYFDYEYNVFFELKTTIVEVSHCLMLEFYKSSITLTNHLLERLLKLALIKKEVGIGAIPIDQWNMIFEEANRKYSSFALGTSIDQCRKQNIITQDERNYLFDTIREQLRNGFGHGDTSKVLCDLPDQTVVFHGSLSKPYELREVKLNQKIIPSMQSPLIDEFSKGNALYYFQFVFELMGSIEIRLKVMDK